MIDLMGKKIWNCELKFEVSSKLKIGKKIRKMLKNVQNITKQTNAKPKKYERSAMTAWSHPKQLDMENLIKIFPKPAKGNFRKMAH